MHWGKCVALSLSAGLSRHCPARSCAAEGWKPHTTKGAAQSMHVSSSSWIMVRVPLLSCFWGCYTEKRELGTVRLVNTPPLFSFRGVGWPVNQVRCGSHVIAVPANLGRSSRVPLRTNDWNWKEVSNQQYNHVKNTDRAEH